MGTIIKEHAVPECGGCTKLRGEYCIAYPSPIIKWTGGRCPLSPYVATKEELQKHVDPIKLSKRMSQGQKGTGFVPKTKKV